MRVISRLVLHNNFPDGTTITAENINITIAPQIMSLEMNGIELICLSGEKGPVVHQGCKAIVLFWSWQSVVSDLIWHFHKGEACGMLIIIHL